VVPGSWQRRPLSQDWPGEHPPISSLISQISPDYVWALKDINLEVKQGEVLGIIVKSRAGKPKKVFVDTMLGMKYLSVKSFEI